MADVPFIISDIAFVCCHGNSAFSLDCLASAVLSNTGSFYYMTVVNYEKSHVKIEHIFVISSPEHKKLKVSYCDRYLSVVRPSAIFFKRHLFLEQWPDLKIT